MNDVRASSNADSSSNETTASPAKPAEAATRSWWGSFPLELGQVGFWHVDALRLWVRRAEREWQIAPSWDTQENDDHWDVALDADMPEEPEGLERHVFTRTRGPFSLLPIVADRAVVASPRLPLFVPPQEKATLYVGSPLWVCIEVEEPAKLLADVPIRRPSDTWFGPSTREGELCYATRTRAVIDVSNLGTLARRAITPVVVENHADDPLRVERLKLPVPYLAVYAAPDGRLWTPEVTMVRQEETGMASFEVGRRPPHDVDAKLLTAAREESEPGLLIRAFSLFRAGQE